MYHFMTAIIFAISLRFWDFQENVSTVLELAAEVQKYSHTSYAIEVSISTTCVTAFE